MIARIHRFHGRGSIRLVHSRGNILRGQLFAVKYFRNDRRRSYRAAVVVSRKVHKSAVVRNRIRRRLYELIRLTPGFQNQPIDLVCVVYSDRVATMPADELAEQFHTQVQPLLKPSAT